MTNFGRKYQLVHNKMMLKIKFSKSLFVINVCSVVYLVFRRKYAAGSDRTRTSCPNQTLKPSAGMLKIDSQSTEQFHCLPLDQMKRNS